MEQIEPAYTVTRIAQMGHTSPKTIYELIDSGRLRAIQFQTNPESYKRNLRIPLSSWQDFLSGKTHRKGRS